MDLCYEIHPSEDLHDGLTFEMFLERVNSHARCNIMYDPSHFVLQALDYLAYIDHYHDRIKMFHVKDAEFRPNGKTVAYGGFQPWISGPAASVLLATARLISKQSSTKLSAYDFDGWVVLKWECCLKNSEDGAAEGARFSPTISFVSPNGPSMTLLRRTRTGASTPRFSASTTELSSDGSSLRPLRLGMVGGGEGAYIGNIHRIAARLDGAFQPVAGAFDIDPTRGQTFAATQGMTHSAPMATTRP